MQIVKKQITLNRSERTQKPAYIVIHDTGNTSKGANSEAHFKYFNSNDIGSSADFFVDDKQVLQVNDYNTYYSFHCGDGAGKYGVTNLNSIGVEICINVDGDYEKTIRNTVDLTSYLMKELEIPFERVIRHYDASRKTCPVSMSKNEWEKWYDFKRKLKESEELSVTQYEELKDMISNLANEVADIKEKMIYNYIDDNMPEWARPTIQKLVDKGILKGDDGGLNLTDELLRIFVINDRAGLYD